MGKLTLAIFLVGAVARAAHADAKFDEAKQHLDAATQLYDENNFHGALAELQRAYELAPSYKILFNIGQVEMELQDYAGALRAYTRYLSEGGPDVPAERGKQVRADLERLRGRVGKIEVQTAAGAEVLIDDVAVGFAPLPEPVAVNAGRHKVTVHIAGKEPVSRVYDVAGRQEISAAIANDAVASIAPGAPVVPAAPTVVDAPAPRRIPLPVYVSWGVTGAFGLTTGVLALVARSANNDLANLRGSFGVTAAQLVAQRDSVHRDALLTDLALGATLASAGVAAYLTLTRMEHGAPPERARTVQVHVGLGGISLTGPF
jgi:tetratricopeptide (TPR) repeat protein